MARVNLYANTRGLCTTWTCQQPVKAALMYPPLICSWVVFAEFSQVNLCYIAAKFLCPFVRFESCTGKKKQMIHEWKPLHANPYSIPDSSLQFSSRAEISNAN